MSGQLVFNHTGPSIWQSIHPILTSCMVTVEIFSYWWKARWRLTKSVYIYTTVHFAEVLWRPEYCKVDNIRGLFFLRGALFVICWWNVYSTSHEILLNYITYTVHIYYDTVQINKLLDSKFKTPWTSSILKSVKIRPHENKALFTGQYLHLPEIYIGQSVAEPVSVVWL